MHAFLPPPITPFPRQHCSLVMDAQVIPCLIFSLLFFFNCVNYLLTFSICSLPLPFSLPKLMVTFNYSIANLCTLKIIVLNLFIIPSIYIVHLDSPFC